MEITSAKFVISNTRLDKCPQDGKPEYAFIGRSNVGKSSLINMLTRNNKLAMTSSTPGKTLLINHFLINNEWYLVDLPGYGYAQRGKKQQEQIKMLIENYILQREQMTCLFVLVDSRHEPQTIDLEFMEWLGEQEIPFAIVFERSISFLAQYVPPWVIQIGRVLYLFFLTHSTQSALHALVVGVIVHVTHDKHF